MENIVAVRIFYDNTILRCTEMTFAGWIIKGASRQYRLQLFKQMRELVYRIDSLVF